MPSITLKHLQHFAAGGGTVLNARRGAAFVRSTMVSKVGMLSARAAPLARSSSAIAALAEDLAQGNATLGALDDEDHASVSAALLACVESLDSTAAAFAAELAREPPEPALAAAQAFARELCGSLIGMRQMIHQAERVSAAALAGEPAVDSIVSALDDVRPLLQLAIDDAAAHCEYALGATATVRLVGGGACVCVPAQLRAMAAELVTNAVVASVRAHGAADAPPVELLASAARGQFGLRVTDLGGGIRPADAVRAFDFGWRGAGSAGSAGGAVLSGAPSCAGLLGSTQAGLGAGLPLARLHAEFMGGSLVLCPEYGVGTRAFLAVRATGHGPDGA